MFNFGSCDQYHSSCHAYEITSNHSDLGQYFVSTCGKIMGRNNLMIVIEVFPYFIPVLYIPTASSILVLNTCVLCT